MEQFSLDKVTQNAKDDSNLIDNTCDDGGLSVHKEIVPDQEIVLETQFTELVLREVNTDYHNDRISAPTQEEERAHNQGNHETNVMNGTNTILERAETDVISDRHLCIMNGERRFVELFSSAWTQEQGVNIEHTPPQRKRGHPKKMDSN